jgi:single-strand DNA-binding protein
MGHLTAQPTLKQLQDGKSVANFTLGINTGKNQTMFLDCEAWDKQAEYIDGTEKGALVGVEGSLKQDQWEDKQTGKKRTKIKCRCYNVGFCRNANQHGAPESTEQEQGQDAKDGQIAADANAGEDAEDIPF